MDTRRLGFALAVALVLSLGVSSFFYLRVRKQMKANQQKTVKIVGAAAKLQPASSLTAQNVVLIDWPENLPLEGTFSKPEEVVGRVLLYPVGPKEPIRQRDLAGSGSGMGLMAKIPDGMRASSVKVDPVNNVSGFLFPGCKVDVVATLRTENNQTITKTVLQNVQVLAAGPKTEIDANAKPDEKVTVVTLLLTPEESEKLALAQSQGHIQFVLRNGGDSLRPETPPVDMAQLTGVANTAAAVKAVGGAKKIVAKKIEGYSVETVAGDKKTVATFE